MPEIAEVINYTNYFRQTSMNHQIDRVEVRDDYLEKEGFKKYKRQLKGQSFQDAFQQGKYLFAHLSSGHHVVMHFGMTGHLEYFKNEEPEYAQVLFHFENDYSLAFICKRKLGWVDATESAEKYAEQNKIGPDILKISKEEFTDYLENKRGGLKSALMKQESVSGIGNILSDEICFRANLHPDSKVSEVKDPEKLYDTAKEIIEVFTDRYPEYSSLPDDYLLKHREEGADCPVCDGTIVKGTINGRSSYFCNSHQK